MPRFKIKNTDASDSPLAAKITFTSGLIAVFGIAAVLLSFWTAMITGLMGKTIYTLIYVDGYEPAVFTIENLVFFKGNNSSTNGSPSEYYAEGDIAGNKEKFKLGDYITGVIQNRQDLEKQVSVGQKLHVLYNKDAPTKLGIRVQYPEKEFKQTIQRRQKKMINTAYLPWIISVGLCLFFGIIGRQIKLAIVFCISSLFLIVFAWIPTLLNLL